MELIFNIIGWSIIVMFFVGLYYPIFIMKGWIKELDKLIENGNKWPEENNACQN